MLDLMFALFIVVAFAYLVMIAFRDNSLMQLSDEQTPARQLALRQLLEHTDLQAWEQRYGVSAETVTRYLLAMDEALLAIIGRTKKAPRESPEWEQAVEGLEKEVQQPQRFHAMPDPGVSAWIVGYVDADGQDAIARCCIDEERARWWAAVINLYDQAGHDVKPLFKTFDNPVAVWGLPGVAYVPEQFARPVPETGRAIK